MESVVYLPVHPDVPPRDLERLGRAVRAFEAATYGTSFFKAFS